MTVNQRERQRGRTGLFLPKVGDPKFAELVSHGAATISRLTSANGDPVLPCAEIRVKKAESGIYLLTDEARAYLNFVEFHDSADTLVFAMEKRDRCGKKVLDNTRPFISSRGSADRARLRPRGGSDSTVSLLPVFPRSTAKGAVAE